MFISNFVCKYFFKIYELFFIIILLFWVYKDIDFKVEKRWELEVERLGLIFILFYNIFYFRYI